MNSISASKNMPMSSAPFIYDENGKVAWDKMWDSYCDLAIEGGPPHRNEKLISKGSNNDLNSVGYRKAVSEVLRAFSLIIPYKHVSTDKGLVEIILPNSNVANWFCQIINSENVECNVEGNKIYLPVNDDFTLEKEIKNVVTVVGKAFHYWSRHRNWFEKALIGYFGVDIRLLVLEKYSV